MVEQVEKPYWVPDNALRILVRECEEPPLRLQSVQAHVLHAICTELLDHRANQTATELSLAFTDEFLKRLAISFTQPAEQIGCNYHFTESGILSLIRRAMDRFHDKTSMSPEQKCPCGCGAKKGYNCYITRNAWNY